MSHKPLVSLKLLLQSSTEGPWSSLLAFWKKPNRPATHDLTADWILLLHFLVRFCWTFLSLLPSFRCMPYLSFVIFFVFFYAPCTSLLAYVMCAIMRVWSLPLLCFFVPFVLMKSYKLKRRCRFWKFWNFTTAERTILWLLRVYPAFKKRLFLPVFYKDLSTDYKSSITKWSSVYF